MAGTRIFVLLACIVTLVVHFASAWRNDEIAKYPKYMKLLKHAGKTTLDLEEVLTTTKTHIYAIVTKARVRQDHMRDFITSSLQLPLPPPPLPLPRESHSGATESDSESESRAPTTQTQTHIDVVAAVEIGPEVSLHSFVEKQVLSRDYNATWRHQRMNRGRLACQLSLVHTLESFLNSSHKNALIFEGE